MQKEKKINKTKTLLKFQGQNLHWKCKCIHEFNEVIVAYFEKRLFIGCCIFLARRILNTEQASYFQNSQRAFAFFPKNENTKRFLF